MTLSVYRLDLADLLYPLEMLLTHIPPYKKPWSAWLIAINTQPEKNIHFIGGAKTVKLSFNQLEHQTLLQTLNYFIVNCHNLSKSFLHIISLKPVDWNIEYVEDLSRYSRQVGWKSMTSWLLQLQQSSLHKRRPLTLHWLYHQVKPKSYIYISPLLS